MSLMFGPLGLSRKLGLCWRVSIQLRSRKALYVVHPDSHASMYVEERSHVALKVACGGVFTDLKVSGQDPQSSTEHTSALGLGCPKPPAF